LEGSMISVAEAFGQYKTRLELTQTEQDDASRRQKDVRATVQESFEVDHDFLTGSYGRHTKTKPLKDVDIFVALGQDEEHRRQESPSIILDDLEKCLVDKYGSDQVERDRRCITVWFEKRNQTQHEEGKVLSLDVVPAFEKSGDYEIPDEGTGTWMWTNPATHAELATSKNKVLDGNWVPLVKMLKGWNRNAGSPIKPSFLIEVMALDLVDGPFNSFPDEARRFFAAAAPTIADDWPDPAGLGSPVSDEMTQSLCDAARTQLQTAEVLATRAYRAEQQGRQSEAIQLWRQIFGSPFPAQ
jgi:hypothetical protein